jgi:prefoldin alpha subunit
MNKEEQMQKLYFEFQVLEQSIKQLEKQSAMLNDQLIELVTTMQSLEDIKNVKEGTEILIPLSNGIYAKAELKDNKSMVVNLGANITGTKTVDATKSLIGAQVEEIKKLQENIVRQLQSQTTKAYLMEQEINNIASSMQEKN